MMLKGVEQNKNGVAGLKSNEECSCKGGNKGEEVYEVGSRVVVYQIQQNQVELINIYDERG